MKIPRDADHVELRMRLEADDYPFYQAVIRAVDGGEVFSQRNIKPRASATVAVKAPATKLPAGDYILTLSGVTWLAPPKRSTGTSSAWSNRKPRPASHRQPSLFFNHRQKNPRHALR